MQRRQFSAWAIGAAWAGIGRAAQADVLSNADAASGIRAALERGATAAVELLGRPDGFLGNPKVRIPLPAFSTKPPRCSSSPASKSASTSS
jgi:hypothetical protein